MNGRSRYQLLSSETLPVAPQGEMLTVVLRSADPPVDVAVNYAVYTGHPVIRKWIAVTNRGGRSMTLTQLVFENLRLAPGPASELEAFGGYGLDPRELFSTGRVSDTAMVVENALTREGLVVMNEAPGYTKRTEIGMGWGDEIRVMYDTDLFPFERCIEPGEAFTSAKSSIAFFVEVRPDTDPHWVIPTYTSEVMMRLGGGYQPPWIYNTWEPFERNIDAKTTRQLIEAGARMGLDLFTIDDGWQLRHGDNAIRTSHFPDGLEPIVASLAKHHMSLGLWVPLAAISTDSPDYIAHPEWLARDSHGRPKFTGTAAGQRAVMCLASGYREAAANRLNALIAKYNVKYLKVDLTTVFNAYGEEPGCYAEGHYHKTPAESLIRIYEGMQYVAEKVRQQHPETLLDYTFELWGEKHLIDPGLLAAADLDWLSNVNDHRPTDAGPRQARTLLYRRSLSIPAETMLIGNLHADTAPIEERFASVIGFGPILLGDLRNLTPAQLQWYGEKIRWFKELRKRVPLNEGFFPLGSWRQPNVASWDGFARLSRKGEGIVVVFRNESAENQAAIVLPAMPAGGYRAQAVVGSFPVTEVSAADLAKGWRIPLKNNVLVLEMTRAAQAGNP